MSVGSQAEMIQNARKMIDLYTKAEIAVLSGQAYVIGGQSLTRADLDKIRTGRQEWEGKLAKYLSCQSRDMWRLTPVDD